MKVRWTKGIVALLLAVMMILGTAACSKGAENTAANGTSENDKTPATGTDTPAAADEPAGTDTPAEEEKTFAVYDNDEDIYMANLGEFYADYQKATEASSVSERYALLAVAEAKVLESGVATPHVWRHCRLSDEPYRILLRRLRSLARRYERYVSDDHHQRDHSR